MRSLPEFLLIAIVVTITPGPATATVIRVAARDGRRAATSAILGNAGGVLAWGVLSAIGVSSLIVASQIAYDALRIGGAAVLIVLGVRSLVHRAPRAARRPAATGWRIGLLTSLANPKLAVFFIALFPQFLSRDAAVLPTAVAMAAAIVTFDLVWYSSLAYAVDRAGALLRPRVQRRLEQLTGGTMVALGIRMAADAR
jgi:threonine/homoserine/homoserine lactone efflux protein